MSRTIEDPHDEVIAFIQNMRSLPHEVIVDSTKLIEKFLKARRYKPLKLFIKESLATKTLFLSEFQEVIFIKDNIFNQIKGYKFSKGVLATFEKPEFVSFDKLQGPYVVLNGLTSPENVGSIVRTITGLGFRSLIIDSKTCSPFLRRCIRVSMGNINFLDVHKVDNMANFLNEASFSIYGCANEPNALTYHEVKVERESAFMIGSEGHGIDEDLKGLCHALIKIPIQEGVLHFNASIACAITASEWSRQLKLS